MSCRQWLQAPMNRIGLAIVLWLAASVSLWSPVASAAAPACLQPAAEAMDTLANGGVGGTGKFPGGVGGTGKVPGGSGGTGIVGVITGFASVCINGLEVHFDAGTSVTRNGAAAQARDLALGQVIAIEAACSAENLVARHISILNTLEGPVTRLTPENGLMYVMGQAVNVNDATRLGGVAAATELKPGISVRVAGFRDAAGTVHATRIEKVADSTDTSAIGVLQQTKAGKASLSGLPLRVATRLPAEVDEVLIRGRWDGQRLVAHQAEPDPSLPFAGRVDRIVAEGLVLERRNRSSLRMTAFNVELTPETHMTGNPDSSLVEGQRIRVSGRLEGRNRIIADWIVAPVIFEPYRPNPQTGHSPPGGAHAGDRAANPDQANHHPERPEREQPGEPLDPPERMERTGPTNGGERIEPPPRPERIERIEPPPRPERIERIEPPPRPERIERMPMLRPEIPRGR